MNCKQGDLAILVKSEAGNEGRIFRCIRLAAADEIGSLNPGLTWWAVDGTLRTRWGRIVRMACDEWLRPIRNPGADAIDEMVELAGPAPMTLTELLREVSE